MPSTNKTTHISLNQYQGNEYQKRTDVNEDNLKIDNKFKEVDETLEANATQLSDLVYKVATGTGTAIIIPTQTLVNGYAKTFIASSNNSSVATTINGKPLYKPGTTTAPNLIAGKAYTVWYNTTSNCFFIKASAEGDADVSHVLATKKFSNDNDTGLVGTMINNGAVTITPGTTNKTIPVGYHNGSGIVVGDADLISANIKAGANIFNIAGKASVVDTSDATAIASSIIAGYTGYVNGSKITGNATIESLGGRKFLTGTALSSTIRSDFVRLSDSVTIKEYFIEISGFNFTPTTILTRIDGHGWNNPTNVFFCGIFQYWDSITSNLFLKSGFIISNGYLKLPIWVANYDVTYWIYE